MPQLIALLRDSVPPAIAQIPGLEPGIFGLLLVLFLIFEPLGIYGRWRKVRLFFEEFPPLPQRHLQTPEEFSAYGAFAVSLLEIENLSVRFGGVSAVQQVSFNVAAGEVFSIVGPNGAGKTTIFNLISRIYDSSEGTLHFNQQDITQVPSHTIAALGIARTFQNTELCEAETVLNKPLDWLPCTPANQPFAGPSVHARSPAPGAGVSTRRRGRD